jgi:hypothetical protein
MRDLRNQFENKFLKEIKKVSEKEALVQLWKDCQMSIKNANPRWTQIMVGSGFSRQELQDFGIFGKIGKEIGYSVATSILMWH